jgi:hypothetical protein
LWMAKLFVPNYRSNGPASATLGMTLDLSRYLPDGWDLFNDPEASIFVNCMGWYMNSSNGWVLALCGTDTPQSAVALNQISFLMTSQDEHVIATGENLMFTITMCLQLQRTRSLGTPVNSS